MPDTTAQPQPQPQPVCGGAADLAPRGDLRAGPNSRAAGACAATTKIRYASMSLPYHIGNGWFGGFLPATVCAIVAGTGEIYAGLWYPIIVAAMTLIIGTLFIP